MTALRQIQTAPPAGQPYVLLIEDELDDEALALRVLKKYRIANHVDLAKDGEEALRRLRDRLAVPGAGPSAGRLPDNPAEAAFRSRSLESGSTGASLLPSAMTSPRALEASPSRPAETRSIPNGSPPPRGRTPELVLLAFDQKKIPALEVVARLRALPGMENVPVALLCRTPDQELQVRESSLPRLSSLSKPIGFFKLLECVLRMDMHWFMFAEKP